GGGWHGPASRRSCPGTTPAGEVGRGQGARGHPTPRLPRPAHLAAREQPVVEVADTVAEAELGHAVVDQQEVPQLGGRRGSHRGEPVRDPRNAPGPPPCPTARPRRPGPFQAPPVLLRTRDLEIPHPQPLGHTGTRHQTGSPGTTQEGLAGHPAPPARPNRSRCGAAAGARPPGPSRARARARSLRARRVVSSDATSVRLSDYATSGTPTPLPARPGRGGAGAARGGPAGPGRRWGRGWAGEAGQGERPRGRWTGAGRAPGARLGQPSPARAGSARSSHRGFPRRSVPPRALPCVAAEGSVPTLPPPRLGGCGGCGAVLRRGWRWAVTASARRVRPQSWAGPCPCRGGDRSQALRMSDGILSKAATMEIPISSNGDTSSLPEDDGLEQDLQQVMVSGPNLNETSIVSGGYGGTAEGIIPTGTIKAPPFPGSLVHPHPPRGPSVPPSAPAARRMARPAAAPAGTAPLTPPQGIPWVWEPWASLGTLVRAPMAAVSWIESSPGADPCAGTEDSTGGSEVGPGQGAHRVPGAHLRVPQCCWVLFPLYLAW
uniref:Uncharacterized protein n=1 Tax=Corvus moneduloides TaxID=1196302 RepID=A0A8U7MEF9_CORMO